MEVLYCMKFRIRFSLLSVLTKKSHVSEGELAAVHRFCLTLKQNIEAHVLTFVNILTEQNNVFNYSQHL